MEIKVKAVDVTGEEKSVAEKEQELLDKHEQSQQETPTQEVAEVKEEEPEEQLEQPPMGLMSRREQ